MAGGGAGGRTLEQTSTWAVATVCFVLVIISVAIEHAIHLITKVSMQLLELPMVGSHGEEERNLRLWSSWALRLPQSLSQWNTTAKDIELNEFSHCLQWLEKNHKRALQEALEKIKSGKLRCSTCSSMSSADNFCTNLETVLSASRRTDAAGLHILAPDSGAERHL
ncbi:hypothetical protein BHM03_00045087 [Ensete ventricosum]|nr:hypothetical protein BHM03_00045087 [Ensete ventricosum]